MNTSDWQRVYDETIGSMAMEFEPPTDEWIEAVRANAPLLPADTGNDLIAHALSSLIGDVLVTRRYRDSPLTPDLLLDMHGRFRSAPSVRHIAGKWRDHAVLVGDHTPPHAAHLALLVENACMQYARDVEHAVDPSQIVAAICQFEAELLRVHPFSDLNGRLSRVVVLELAQRHHLPLIRTWTMAGTPEHARYLAALHDYDNTRNTQLLQRFWAQHRLHTLAEGTL